MSKNTTKYVVISGTDFDSVRDVKGKKQAAIDLATQIRADEKISVVVVTSSTGLEVFSAKARKPQKRTPAYTRVVSLPEGFQAPEGQRVAYLRTRKNAAIMHDAEEQLYTVRRFTTGELLGTFDTTRQCGRFLADHVTPEGAVVPDAQAAELTTV